MRMCNQSRRTLLNPLFSETIEQISRDRTDPLEWMYKSEEFERIVSIQNSTITRTENVEEVVVVTTPQSFERLCCFEGIVCQQ